MLWAGLLCLALAGFDLYVSYKRIKTYGPFAELNPLVRQLIADFGLKVGLAAGFVQNLLTVLALYFWGHPEILWYFAGTKSGLVLMQLKSLQMESFVEKVLAKARAKKATSGE